MVVLVWGSNGCGGGGPGPGDGGARDASSDVAPQVPKDAAVVPVPPDAPIDTAPPPPPDVREMLLDAAIPCMDGGTCAAPAACCNGICVDTSKDPRHCGACGRTCSETQFCTGTACDEAVFANVCGNPNATVIKDPYEADNKAAAAIGAALMMSCAPPTMVVVRDQGEPGVLSASGRPLASAGTSYLMGGGSFGQRGVDYLDKTDMTSVYLSFDGTTAQFHRRRPAEVVLSTPATALNDGHDYFYLQMFVEPLSGTLCINAIGMYAPGTLAGSYWLATEIIPKRDMYPDTWYVYEWTDSGDKVANAADTFRLVAHGR
jgi:hypothetical protein